MIHLLSRLLHHRFVRMGRPIPPKSSRWDRALSPVALLLLAIGPLLPSLPAAHPLEPPRLESLEACTVFEERLHAGIAPQYTPVILESTASGYLPVVKPEGTMPAEPNAGTTWTATLQHSGRFLFIQHAVRIGTQHRTRRNLRGPYFRDYVNSVRGFSGWDDGDSWLTNYVGHPMQGSISGYFQVHNHPRERLLEFSSNSAYWKSRLKAMAFSAAYSTHYELSPIGEAGIGNVGLHPGTKGAVDLVITPTLGFAWMIGEDAIDAKIIAPLERRLRYPGSRRLLRTALNPTRTFANFLRGVAPWHRDTRGDVK
ncbi:MAG: hypothetical protein KIT83_06840 [Bryobacterales bacterium]|nr:hypothetical protein [Bryobacterales bacterium]